MSDRKPLGGRFGDEHAGHRRIKDFDPREGLSLLACDRHPRSVQQKSCFAIGRRIVGRYSSGNSPGPNLHSPFSIINLEACLKAMQVRVVMAFDFCQGKNG
jgi:hypothetical protein